MQILLVENEKLTLDGIYRTLPWSELGVEQVHRAMNGVQGVQIAKEIMPEIIITDIKMPRLDGIGMARCIREFLPQSTQPAEPVTAPAGAAGWLGAGCG